MLIKQQQQASRITLKYLTFSQSYVLTMGKNVNEVEKLNLKSQKKKDLRQ